MRNVKAGKMRYDCQEVHWSRVSVKGVLCFFNGRRIDRYTIPDGMHMYEAAEEESDGVPVRMRPGILVNFVGTVLSEEVFQPGEGDTVWLDEGDWEWLE